MTRGARERPMTASEKLFARKAGVFSVSPGEIIVVEADVICVDDVQFAVFAERHASLAHRIAFRERVVLIADHYSPPSGLHEAQTVSALAEFGREHGFKTFLRAGVKHPLFIEYGLVKPGDLLIATDSHTNTAGAVGALGVALGPSDIAGLVATGQTWMRVPETIKIELHGELPPGVRAMDVALSLLGEYGRGFANYRSIEWSGDGIKSLSLAARMTLCNLTTEFGAKTTIVPSAAQADLPLDIGSDTGAHFEKVLSHHLEKFQPVIAGPPDPSNVGPINDFRGIRIDQAYLGTCAHGSLEDLQDAAAVLRGRRVREGVELIVTPPTAGIYDRALRDGTLRILVDAGATICAPGCGSCPGVHQGTLADGQVRISTQSRNFVGRSGHRNARIYLASPVVVAASAIAGEIVHPAQVTG